MIAADKIVSYAVWGL